MTSSIPESQDSTSDQPDGFSPLESQSYPEYKVDASDTLSIFKLQDNLDGDFVSMDNLEKKSYVLGDEIGRGGEGVVRKAIQVSLNREVAVKTIRHDLEPNDLTKSQFVHHTTKRFFQEALIAAQLDHPNILPIHDIGRLEDGSPALAMKLVRGRPWSEVLWGDFRNLPPDRYLQKHLPIFISMMQAVAFAHSKGIVHRDLKPSQVMLGEFGEVVLLDWGVAVSLNEETPDTPVPSGSSRESVELPKLFSAPSPAGTPALMAPEQTLDHAGDISLLTDIYLLGGILYYILTGTFPHDSTSLEESMKLARKGKIISPQERAKERSIPEDLTKLTLRALQPNPKDRLKSVKDFIQAVEEFLTGDNSRRNSLKHTESAAERLAGLRELGLVMESEETGGYHVKLLPNHASVDEIYPVLDEVRLLLELALTEWSHNPELQTLRSQTAAASALAACSAGDLNVARHLALQIQHQSAKQIILKEIQHKETIQLRKEQMRKLSLTVVCFLLVILVIGTIRVIQEQQITNKKLALERDEAESAKFLARHQQQLAENANALLEEESYFATINFANTSLKEGNYTQVHNLLLKPFSDYLHHWEWGNIWHKSLGDAMTLTVSSEMDSILAGAFSFDDQTLYTGDRTGVMSIWQASTGKLLEMKQLHQDSIWDIVASPDGKTLLTCSFDHTAKLIDTKTLEVLHVLEGHQDVLRGGAFSPDSQRVVTTSRDKTIRLWDVQSGEQIGEPIQSQYSCYDVEFNNTGTQMAVAERKFAVIRDGVTGEEIARTPEHPENILSLKFSPDDSHLLTSNTDRNARVFSFPELKEILKLENKTSWLHSCDWSPDGRLIVTGDNEGTCRIWDANSGELYQTIQSYRRTFHLRFSNTGDFLMSVSNRSVQLWNMNKLPLEDGILTVHNQSNDIPNPDIITQAYSAPLELNASWLGYDVQFRAPNDNGRTTYNLGDETIAVDSFYTAFQPNGQHSLTISDINQLVTLKNLDTNETLPWEFGKLYSACWSPDSRFLAIVTLDGVFALHDGNTFKRLYTLGTQINIAEYTSAKIIGVTCFSADSSQLFTGKRDGSASIWSTSTGALIHQLSNLETCIMSAAFSPDGTLVAAGGHSAVVRVWNTQTGEVVCGLNGHQDNILSISFSPDNFRIVTASQDDIVKLWETDTGRHIMDVISLPDTRFLLGAGFTPDGQKIYAIASNRVLLVADSMDWNIHGSPQEIMFAMELEKRRRRLNPDVTMEDIITSPLDFTGKPSESSN